MSVELVQLKKMVRDNLDVVLSIDGSGGSLKTRRGLQHFVSLRLCDPTLSSIYELLLKSAIEAESKCPGAGLCVLSKWSDYNRRKTSIPLTRTDLQETLKESELSDEVIQILSACLDLAGTTSSMSIKKSSSGKTYIDVNEGYTFSAKHLFRYSPLEAKNAHVLCIDGFIENVSEIHHLLEDLSTKKSVCALLTRGMSDDVVHTLRVNFDRKTVQVIPFAVPFDVENSNLLVDVATVSGIDVTSSLKGDLISSCKVDENSTVDKMTLSYDTIRIQNKKTRKRVSEHVENLKKKIEERPEISEILSKRLKSLSSSCVDICLPEDLNVSSKTQQLDFGIRLVSSIIKNNYDLESVVSSSCASLETLFDSMFTVT